MAVHDPRSPCEGSLRAVHPVILAESIQETLVDGSQVDDEKAVHRSIKADHCGSDPSRSSHVPSKSQALGKPPCCGPVKVPAVGAAPVAVQSLAATPASRA